MTHASLEGGFKKLIQVKVTKQIFWNSPDMFPTKHYFEKFNTKDRSQYLFKR